jgi:hypothetical protein
MGAALSQPSADDANGAVGRRTTARLRLAIPARFVSLYATHPCIMLDLSCTGARLALAEPLAEGQSGVVTIARCEAFGAVVRTERGPEGGVNAVAFDEPLTKVQVLDIRRFAEEYALREKSALLEQVRMWVSGED